MTIVSKVTKISSYRPDKQGKQDKRVKNKRKHRDRKETNQVKGRDEKEITERYNKGGKNRMIEKNRFDWLTICDMRNGGIKPRRK